MFYSDSTMHKIYEDDGSFDFTYQLPIMIYSMLISSFLKILLNFFGLYESNIIDIKKGDFKYINVKKEMFRIKFKILVFFIITYLLLFFIWIYLGCFCAFYKNTQIHLLYDVSSSFAISFISPIFIDLIPGMFRIYSIRKYKNSKSKMPLLFKFCKIFQML